jgi:alpha-methylacyl-CoA racemase
MTERFAAAFAMRTRDEWVSHFAGKDACVSPILDPEEAIDHPHNRGRHTAFGPEVPVRAPIMEGLDSAPRDIDLTDKTAQLLSEVGFTAEQIKAARGGNAPISGLAWPPF